MKEHSCENCKHIDKGIESQECTGCIHNAIEKWQPMTNGDRIRRMSDEELAIFLEAIECSSHHWCEECTTLKGKPCNGLNDTSNALVADRLKWLKAEVE